MPKGKLHLHLTDLRGEALNAKVELEFDRMSGDLGVGGEDMEVSINMNAETEAIISGLPCRGGIGTMYRVSASTPHCRVYSYFQRIVEDTVSGGTDDVEFWVKPGDVSDIEAPAFEELPDQVRQILNTAQMKLDKPEDKDLLGLSGAELYEQLGPLRKACLLNIAKKASHETTDNCLLGIEDLLVCRQDRFFAFVNSALLTQVNDSPRFKSAGNGLHPPLAGFSRGPSFKSRDAHANIQLTFMVHDATGRMAADIDIDESSGIEHGLEVIHNAFFKKRTNPYLIREFLLSADPLNHSLDPGYGFIF
jgi:hypothetical protein